MSGTTTFSVSMAAAKVLGAIAGIGSHVYNVYKVRLEK
jgi:hypothetical protein